MYVFIYLVNNHFAILTWEKKKKETLKLLVWILEHPMPS